MWLAAMLRESDSVNRVDCYANARSAQTVRQ